MERPREFRGTVIYEEGNVHPPLGQEDGERAQSALVSDPIRLKNRNGEIAESGSGLMYRLERDIFKIIS